VSADTLQVRGPYTDGTFAVIEKVGDRLVGRGFHRSKGLADAALFKMRDQRRGGR
jgi:hypothetical protein